MGFCGQNEALDVALTSLFEKIEAASRYEFLKEKLPHDVSSYNHYSYLEDIYDLVSEAEGVSVEEFLDQLGQELIATTCKKRLMERAFRCLGGNLQEFLTTLDGVHDVLQGEGQPERASFVCTADPAGHLDLLFATERPAVALLLLGSLKAIADRFYRTDAKVSVSDDDEPGRYRYRIIPTMPSEEGDTDDDADVVTSMNDVASTSLSRSALDLRMGVASFCKAFPWHFVVDRRLEMVQLGAGFMQLFAHDFQTLGTSVATYFEFRRPRGIALCFSEIVKRANTPFVLAIRWPDSKAEERLAEGLELKGQMVFCPESDSILFVGSPFLDGLDGLTGRGLFISDIPLHDATRDVILIGEQARAQDGLRRRMDKLKNSIEETNQAVDKERQKNVSLLHLIFPPDIAKRLWLGQPIEAKTHDDVTMLFSDIVGFTSICSTATPMMVINMLQDLYNQFDVFCGQLDVYKVETIGDAYCVACGLHKQSSTHAQQSAWMALKMIETCSRHRTHDGKPIKMRIGLHTGTVLAGVVGKKMPRYCLFGHNVTIANKFESGSEPLKTNVSPTTYQCLQQTPGFSFAPRPSDCLPVGFPAHIPGTCHFLLGYRHPDLPAECSSLSEHVEAGVKDLGIFSTQQS
ncbi:head-specific guanylate cyclase isoform X2 [Zootermopsis nevadensis]|uniref:head-specific guanylate cyclase isoform X2 n=1 Tax=Zootermopsis nevadensis TaxID=136037 RepID=UPI000B8E82B4|nr:head-specific guanylate cyclase isoform X2 [Zootermopsis nevadensis]XP_021940698.1 head-specific guanylate cyclase isoform X2 [Zootermopsis nevadensis]XP_021940699.1 head-specific guanylate cyclase isoform X2 [Zootermopsis nevadensis]